MWGKAKKDKKLIKFGGGFYCASLLCEEDQIYAFNGFFISMRSKFVAEGVSIYCHLVDWKSSACTWEDFRGKVLGPTDPEAAPTDSLRGAILAQWEDMDSDLCLAHCQLIASFAGAKKLEVVQTSGPAVGRSAQFRAERILMGLERHSNHSSS